MTINEKIEFSLRANELYLFKAVNQEVVSVGFPPTQLVFQMGVGVDETEFLSWKNGIEKVRKFDLSNATPMTNWHT
ncbi:MAG: hypothetical protein LBS25_02145 [Candidatus Symbiothrix sp.]|jgi:hypothetical protein|nr:hypothetical protein [Candidatus Symbiothrix sp.]